MRTSRYPRTIVGYLDQLRESQFTYPKVGAGADWKTTAN